MEHLSSSTTHLGFKWLDENDGWGDKMEANEVKREIIRLYYEEHKRPSKIAPIICKTPQYVSKIATKDERYKNEKQHRKMQSLEKKKLITKNIIRLMLEMQRKKKIEKNIINYLQR